VIPATLDNVTHGELQKYENNYKALNLIITAIGRNVYDHVAHIENAHDVWLKLCNTYEGLFEIKSSRKDTYNRQYQLFSHKSGKSLNDCFARFESIMSSLCSCGPLAYSDNGRAKHLLYAFDDSVWGMKITALEESVDFATLDIKKLFSKLRSHELSRKGHPNHDASLASKAFVTSAHVGGHHTTPPTPLSHLLWSLSCPLWPRLLMSSTRGPPSMRSPCWQGSFTLCTSSTRRGGDHLGAASSAATPPTSWPTALRGRSLTPPPTSMTVPSGTTTTRVTTRRSTTSRTRRRSSRR
jgi:hypothetical protein